MNLLAPKTRGALWVTLLFLLIAAAGQIFADSTADEREIEHILDLFEKAYLKEDTDLPTE